MDWRIIEFTRCPPHPTPIKFFFYGDTSKIRFLAQNLQWSVRWEQQLNENAPKCQLKWFVEFSFPCAHIISCAWSGTIISSNTPHNTIMDANLCGLIISRTFPSVILRVQTSEVPKNNKLFSNFVNKTWLYIL